MKKYLPLLIAVVFCALFFVGYASYSGLSYTIEPELTEMEDLVVIVNPHKGTLEDANKEAEKLFKEMDDAGIEYTRAVAVLLSDFRTVPPDQRETEIGIVLEEQYHAKKYEITDNYILKTYPATKAVKTVFPRTTKLSDDIHLTDNAEIIYNYIQENDLTFFNSWIDIRDLENNTRTTYVPVIE